MLHTIILRCLEEAVVFGGQVRIILSDVEYFFCIPREIKSHEPGDGNGRLYTSGVRDVCARQTSNDSAGSNNKNAEKVIVASLSDS